MEKHSIKNNLIFYSFIFVFFFIFFSKAHPIIPFDADDWTNMNFFRSGYPTLASWNPTRILPGCLGPFAGLIAAYVITPIMGDYIDAQIVTNAILVSLLISVYLYLAQKVIQNIFNISNITCYLLVILFAAFHFLLLRTRFSYNEYLWFSPNANCYYHYTIPNLLCSSLVLWLMHNDINKIKDNIKIGIFIFILYLALCSNLYSTVILIAYIGSILLIELFTINKKENRWLRKYIQCNKWYLVIVGTWIVVQLMEINSTRAQFSNVENPFIEYTILSLKNLLRNRYNICFLLICIIGIFGAKLMHYIKIKHKIFHIGYRQSILILSLFFSATYLVLLCSRVDPLYLFQGQVIFSYAFFVLLLVIICIAYLVKHTHYFKFILPFIVFIVLFEINTKAKTFRDVQYEYTNNVEACRVFDKEIIKRAKIADIAGKDSIICIVPNFGNWDNWPFTDNFYEFGPTLLKHNVLNRKVEIVLLRKENMPVHKLSEPFFINQIK